MKKLIITEKPSVARDIAKVLGVTRKSDGYMEGEHYVITWAVGHLITLFEPEDYRPELKKWNYQSLPIIPEEIKIKPYEKTKKQLEIIKYLCDRKDVTSLICATDSGREGELIFRYIYSFIECHKPFERLWISSMTDEAIQEGFQKLKDGNEYNRLYMSAKCRSESDWLVGINATRAYTSLNHTLLSIGRVQTPTLALLVNRQFEIDQFVPRDYYEVIATYEEEYSGTWFKEQIGETKIDTIEEAQRIVDVVSNKEGKVLEVEKANGNQKPPFLYDLTELQRDGNRMFGYTANQVLEIAQALYEKRKLLTYPRTDSRFLSDDMKAVVEETLQKINVKPYDKAIAPLIKDGKLSLKFSKRIIDNSKITDHHAIIPTNKNPEGIRMSEEEKNIYNLVVKRLIAVFYPDYTFQTTKVIVEVEKETFVSKGKIVKDLGWKKLYQKDQDQEDQLLPPIKKNDKVKVEKAELTAKKTSPPKPYTEATLLSAMENAGRFVEEEELKEQLKESGFGTPATRAGIIERLISVKYIYRKGKSIFPTEKGINLIKIVPKQLTSPEMTGKWERGLTKISQDKLATEPFMESIHKFVAYIVRSAQKSQHLVQFEEDRKFSKEFVIKGKVFGECPICKKGKITENTKSYYCSEFVHGCKFTIWKSSRNQYEELSEELLIELIQNKEAVEQKEQGKRKYSLQEDGTLRVEEIKE